MRIQQSLGRGRGRLHGDQPRVEAIPTAAVEVMGSSPSLARIMPPVGGFGLAKRPRFWVLKSSCAVCASSHLPCSTLYLRCWSAEQNHLKFVSKRSRTVTETEFCGGRRSRAARWRGGGGRGRRPHRQRLVGGRGAGRAARPPRSLLAWRVAP